MYGLQNEVFCCIYARKSCIVYIHYKIRKTTHSFVTASPNKRGEDLTLWVVCSTSEDHRCDDGPHFLLICELNCVYSPKIFINRESHCLQCAKIVSNCDSRIEWVGIVNVRSKNPSIWAKRCFAHDSSQN